MLPYTGAAIAVFVLFHACFVIAIQHRRNDFADVIWGPGFLVGSFGALVGQISSSLFGGIGLRQFIALVCLTIWAIRIGNHIAERNLKRPDEDARYKAFRDEWGDQWIWRSYLQVFLLQGVLLLVIIWPIVAIIAASPSPADESVYASAFLWLIGFAIESISDWQLQKFKLAPENKHKIMTSGLWAWSRHPNYFGEVIQWWALFGMAVSLPHGWMTVISPITITFLIVRVTGIPMLEKLMLNRPGFAEYKNATSIFFLWPPKK